MALRRTVAALLAAASILVLLPAAQAGASVPSNWDKGFNFTTWWNDTLGTQASAASMDQMTTTHANSIAIVVTWYQAGATSTTMAPDSRTPSDAAITTAISRARSRGLKVMLVPHVDSNDGVWRGSLTPTSASTWFANYTKMLVHYADLARTNKVAQLSVGTEFKSLSGSTYSSSWKSLIASVRQHFSGSLTYAANWDEYKSVNWWGSLNVIGVDGYFPLTLDPYTPMTADQIAAAWNQYYMADLQAVTKTYGRPLEFTEVGYTSTASNVFKPFQVLGAYDADAQVRAFNGLFQAFKSQAWFRGMYIWNWDGGWTGSGGSSDTSWLVQNKPAQSTITNWFS
jgi:hypothetical protein